MKPLPSLPAFGWETASSNANAVYTATYADLETRKKIASYSKSNPAKNPMEGFTYYDRFSPNVKKRLDRQAPYTHYIRNFKKIVGYFPVAGTFMGIYNYNLVKNMPLEKLPNKNWHIKRSYIEMSSCGLPLIMADLFVTLFR